LARYPPAGQRAQYLAGALSPDTFQTGGASALLSQQCITSALIPFVLIPISDTVSDTAAAPKNSF